MSNLEKYNAAFIDSFGINAEKLNGLLYQSIPEWDSIGHMQLVAALEDSFQIMLETDDLSSYEIGKKIIAKYGVVL